MEKCFTLEARGLSVGYGKKEIVKNLEFTVNPGEIITLIGPNGSGKSTILKSLAAQLAPLSGSVMISGRNQKDMNEKEIAKTMSVLLTGKAGAELITCGEIVESGRYPYTGMFGFLNADDRKISENAMKLTGISYLRDTDFTKISDGQRQLVMLARAVCQEPQIMILDEPTSFLDISSRIEIMQLLQTLAYSQGKSILVSTHDIELARRYADTWWMMGKDSFHVGTPEDLISSGTAAALFNRGDVRVF